MGRGDGGKEGLKGATDVFKGIQWKKVDEIT